MESASEPDERALVEDLASVRFLSGVDHAYWRVVDRVGTIASFEITAAGGRRVGVRLDCSGYPGVAPTGQLWSVADDAPLPVEDWPTGGRASQVFNPAWSVQNGGAFYFPFDRRARVGHEAWANDHTGHVWCIDKTIVDVLHLLREVLRTATGPSMKSTEDEAAS
jgi:hypothetical protein